MNASAFLSHLESHGVRLTQNAGELAVKTRRGVSDDAYIDLIRLNRAGLLATLAGERHDIPWITPGDLHWVHVDQREVDETVPPADWDGTLPEGCGWPHICGKLGPCARHAVGEACRMDERRSIQPVRGAA